MAMHVTPELLCMVLALTAWLTTGCGSAPPPAPEPPPVEPAEADATPPQEVEPPPAATSDIGGMNEELVEQTFATMGPEIESCLSQGSKRFPAMGGHFEIKLRVTADGSVRWAYMSASTLGNRETETCLLNAARSKTWPKPLGGEGLASRAFDIDPRRRPKVVDAQQFRKVLRVAAKQTSRCRHPYVPGKFKATVYVGWKGKVLSAGIAPPSEKGEPIVDCMIKTLHKIRFGAGGRVTKLTFDLW